MALFPTTAESTAPSSRNSKSATGPTSPMAPGGAPLYTADRIAPCDSPLPAPPTRQLHNKNATWRVGYHETTRCSDQLRAYEITAAANRWLDRHCPQLSGAAP
jgi:hypothetical protein